MSTFNLKMFNYLPTLQFKNKPANLIRTGKDVKPTSHEKGGRH